MPLGTEQPLSRSAIVANENFFSHAKEVSTARDRICQGLFFFARSGNLPEEALKENACMPRLDL